MNNKNFLISGIILSISVAIVMFWFFGSTRSLRDADTFVVGTAGGYAPWVSMNEKGEYEGFDIDVSRALAQQMGKDLEIKDLGSMTPLFLALEQGSVDVIIWGLSITQARLDKVVMVRYHGDKIKSYPLLFWEKIPENIESINDMNNMVVCVEPASSQEAVLRKYPNIEMKLTDQVDSALLNIKYGKATAAFVEPAIANKFKRVYPEIVTMNVQLSVEDQVLGVGIAIKKDNKDLAVKVEKAVSALIKNGVIAQSEKKWDIL